MGSVYHKDGKCIINHKYAHIPSSIHIFQVCTHSIYTYIYYTTHLETQPTWWRPERERVREKERESWREREKTSSLGGHSLARWRPERERDRERERESKKERKRHIDTWRGKTAQQDGDQRCCLIIISDTSVVTCRGATPVCVGRQNIYRHLCV